MSSGLADVRLFRPGEIGVVAGDVTTVGCALSSCDPQTLLSAVLGAEAGWRFPARLLGDSARRSLLGKIGASLDIIAALSSDASGLRDASLAACKRRVLVPWEWFDVEGEQGLIRRRVGVACLDAGDVECMREVVARRISRDASSADVEEEIRRLVAEQRHAPWLWQNLAQVTDGLALSPWTDTVAMPLWLPRPLCDGECAFVLASIFWKMTYLGFDGGAQAASARGGPLEQSRRCAESPGGGVRLPDESEAGCDARLFNHEMDMRGLSRVDREYADQLGGMVTRANYHSWIDMLEAFVQLAACWGGVPGAR